MRKYAVLNLKIDARIGCVQHRHSIKRGRVKNQFDTPSSLF